MCNALKSFKELQDENAMLKGMNKRYESRLKAMEQTMEDLMRRLSYYENPHSPPSQNSIPTRQRKASSSSSKGSSGTRSPAPGKKAPGRSKGHDGVSHHRRPTRTRHHHRPKRCSRCGSTDMQQQQQQQCGPATSRIITDIEHMPEPVTTNHLAYPAVCRRCGCNEPDVPGIPGTCIGPNLASIITNLYAMPGSLGSIRTALHEMFGLKISKAAVQRCLHAVSGMLEEDIKGIEHDMSCSDRLHMDETPVMIDRKQGYIWIAVGRKDSGTLSST